MWENPNPTAIFTEQTIELNSTDFDYYEIFVRRSNTGVLIVSQKSLINHGMFIITADSGFKIFARQFNWIAPNKLQIKSAVYEGASTANEALVPVRIIGYKF